MGVDFESDARFALNCTRVRAAAKQARTKREIAHLTGLKIGRVLRICKLTGIEPTGPGVPAEPELEVHSIFRLPSKEWPR